LVENLDFTYPVGVKTIPDIDKKSELKSLFFSISDWQNLVDFAGLFVKKTRIYCPFTSAIFQLAYHKPNIVPLRCGEGLESA
jgi:hypothetical protein